MSADERFGILETKVSAVEESVADHESRIRANERLGYKMLAVSAAGAFLGGAMTLLFAFLATQ